MSLEEFANTMYDLGYNSFDVKVASVTTGDKYTIDLPYDDKTFGGDYLDDLFEEVLKELREERKDDK